MVNFAKLVNKLKQDALILFGDEGVFKIFIDIYLQKQNHSHSFVVILGGFPAVKCLYHCSGRCLIHRRYSYTVK